MKAFSAASPIGYATVAIGRTSTGFHVVLGHRRDREEWKALHLAWHYDLRNESTANVGKYVWQSLSIPQPLQRAIAGVARLIDTRNPEGIPYGFGAARFSAEGEFIPDSASGMTCVSFVLAAIESAGLQLLRQSDWRDVDDSAWREEVIAALNANCVEREHIESVANSARDWRRISPSELGGGLRSAMPYPVARADCLKHEEQFSDDVDRAQVPVFVFSEAIRTRA